MSACALTAAGPVATGSGAGGGGSDEVPRGAPGLAHRQRQRRPAERAAELDDRRHHRRDGEQVGRHTDAHPAVAVEQRHPIGERHHPLQPVLGEQHGHPEVVHQPGEGGEHLLGGGGVERGRRLVEHEQPRVHGEHRPDRHPLLLAARERAQLAGSEVGHAEQVERLLHAAAHRGLRQPQLLHAVGQLLLHGVGDEAGERVLAHVADRVGALARRRRGDHLAVEPHLAPQRPAGEPGHEPGDDAEQRRLARAGRPAHQHQLALVDGEVDVAQHGHVVVAEGHSPQLDHDGHLRERLRDRLGAQRAGRRRRHHGGRGTDQDAHQRDHADLRRPVEGRERDQHLVAAHPPPDDGNDQAGERHGHLGPRATGRPGSGCAPPGARRARTRRSPPRRRPRASARPATAARSGRARRTRRRTRPPGPPASGRR